MKYEAVFGDQRLFDDAPEECFCVAKNVYDSRIFYKAECGALFWLDDDEWKPLQVMSCIPLAMRRIIKEPKRWTWEDKKAGRLPEVGTKVMQCNEYCTVDILSVHHGYIVACNSEIDDSRPVSFAIEKFIELFNPIETPAEKAARLKSEWCAKAAKQLKNLEYTSTLKSIYDALLSGKLAAPKGGE